MEFVDDDILTEMSDHTFYKTLFDILSVTKLNYPFKLSVSYLGYPYVSLATWFGQTTSLIQRTLTRQPTLIQFLNYPGYLQPEEDKKVLIGTYIGAVFIKLMDVSKNRDCYRENLAHNLLMLASSYDLDRYEEILCIRAISRKIMTPKEYYILLDRRSYLPHR